MAKLEAELETLQSTGQDSQIFQWSNSASQTIAAMLQQDVPQPPVATVTDEIPGIRKAIDDALATLLKSLAPIKFTVTIPRTCQQFPSVPTLGIQVTVPLKTSATVSPPLQQKSSIAPAPPAAYHEITSAGRKVFFYKVDSRAPLTTYTRFADDRHVRWWAPRSDIDAQRVIEVAHTLAQSESWYCMHAWVVTHGVASDPNNRKFGGFDVRTAVDDVHGNHTSVSVCNGKGFTAVRKLSCSFGNPMEFGYTRCWDMDHAYDWLVCEL
eukprot:TRINITY_DN3283_c1_g1_i1.p1 TRINITY_DN3283_c1_g1~~TRINITY_DN3283_c1_g1_i1.p1  ORF type:complete len:267 (+),score=56.87 TRINITY_DN3283_c1_g1_i1:512-1312(+)